MAERTLIEWADSTGNLWIGCTKVSPGCDHCYAEASFDLRRHRVTWGPHGDRVLCKQGWKDIMKWQRRAAANGGVDPVLGRRRVVFVNSLSDFFDNHRSVTWRPEAWKLIRSCPDLIFLILTKRPGNIENMLPQDWLGGGFEHVMLGATVTSQPEANNAIPKLRAVPGCNQFFLSVEPLLNSIALSSVWDGKAAMNVLGPGGISWVILGGESGTKARPMALPFARKIVRDCLAAGTPIFVKQLGRRPSEEGGQSLVLAHKKGADVGEWPPELRIQQFPAFLRAAKRGPSGRAANEKESLCLN